MLNAGRIAEAIPQLRNEAQARELTRLDGEAEVTEVWHELCDDYGAENVTAALVRGAVEKKLRPRASTTESTNGARASAHGDELVRAQQALSKAYNTAAGLIAAWLDGHPEENRETVCRQVAPISWQALEARVRRRLEATPR